MLFSKKGSKKRLENPVPAPVKSDPEAPAASAPWYGWTAAPETRGGQVIRLDMDRPPKLQRIILQPGETVVGLLPMASVRAGDEVKVDVPITPVDAGQLVLRIFLIRNSGGEPGEGFKDHFRPALDPASISVRGKFARAHSSLRVELKNLGQAVADFTAAQPRVLIG